MTHWNPNLFRKEGSAKGYELAYLNALVEQGDKSTALGVPVVFSLAHLANLSRTLYSDLHGFVRRAEISRADFPYKNFPISKRTGGKRWISIPVPPLMAVQQWINQNILNRVVPHAAAFAYVPKRKLIDHAKRHCGADWLVKIDIKDFFSNISERQVFDVFLKLGYPKLLSFEMARLCTRVTPKRRGARWTHVTGEHAISDYSSQFVGSLPQGAPTSPALSNLVCIELDKELTQLATALSATYSRYADDLCFSFVGGSRQSAFDLKREVSKVLWKHGFSENTKKTRIVPPGARKVLTGLNVNASFPTVPKEVRDLVRMHLYYAKLRGIPDHCKERGFRSVIGFKNHLFGLIGYVATVDVTHGEIFLSQFNSLPWVNFDL
ncbi:reverse transcriptase family protein [Zoogloea sp.]|uniref:reverse transcriptase family protein n=1 Tax=Zoogloea sp. TaxID=49181 RepID=UPI001D7B3B7E|nr:reverse transcriptase family protein [Zoogloea sp.]MBK6655575.1 RNA-directed DNA polymerase [Zoogloea sp.]MBK7846922.1 RNA-directed DNA polymerase [Zoogloea sp.]